MLGHDALLALVLTIVATTAGARSAPVNPYPGYRSATYADPAHWLRRPDVDDVCDHDLDAIGIRANGRTRVAHWHPAHKPKIDCCYVYPTISTDPTPNSDFVPGPNDLVSLAHGEARALLAGRRRR
jgi:hypothetical protein